MLRKADFISKLHISLKETCESIYWLTFLKRTGLMEYNYDELLSLAEEIKRMLIASLNTELLIIISQVRRKSKGLNCRLK